MLKIVKHMLLALLVISATLMASFVLPAPVSAQEPTPEPTPTATPGWLQAVPMSTGSTLLIERRVSYGDIAVTAAVLVLATITLVAKFVEIPRMWFIR